jgi:DNA ligase (NAD+)
MVEKLQIKHLSDLFKLSHADIAKLEGFADLSINNLLTSIDESKNITQDRFIYSLGIPNVGDTTSHDLADKYPTPKEFFNAKADELMAIRGIGEEVARSVMDFLANEENRAEMERLISLGVNIKPKEKRAIKQTVFTNKKICFTGTLDSMSRPQAKQKVEELGGHVIDSVTKQLDYLVTGSDPGSKLDKAKALGVSILDEQEFLKLLKQAKT